MKTSKTASRVLLMAILVHLAFVPSSVASTLLAYWNFNDSSDRLGVSQGQGALTLAPILVSGTNYGFYTNNGPTVNALPGVPDGQYLALAPTNTSGLGNGVTWVEFNLNMTGYHDLQMSFAQIRNHEETFNIVTVSYSTDGTSYTNHTNYTYNSTTNTATLQTLDLSSITALNDQEDVFIRLTYSGATSFGLARRIGVDNVQFTAIPEASTIGMLLGTSGMFLILRNRKRRKLWTAQTSKRIA